MKLLKGVLSSEGWHLSGPGNSIQIAVKKQGKPGKSHIHQKLDEHFLVLEGWFEISINEETHRLNKGDLLRIDSGEVHHMLSKSLDAHYIIFMPAYQENDKVDVTTL